MKLYKFTLIMDEQENFKLEEKDIHKLSDQDEILACDFESAICKFMNKHYLNEIIEYYEEDGIVEYLNGANGMACRYEVEG